METYHTGIPETIPTLDIRSGRKAEELNASGNVSNSPATWKRERSVPHLPLRAPSQADMRDCRPQRGTGAPARTRSHKQNILRLLRERGHVGVRGSELYSRPDLYGRSPRNRISELRAEGAFIEGKSHGAADWWYRMICEPEAFEPESAKPAEKLEVVQRRAPVVPDDLPLFAGVP
jgi:hypothetical protein